MTAIPYEERLRIMTDACQRIIDGDTVRDAAIAAGTTRATLWEWAAQDARLGDRYARARSISADAYDDEALAVARASTPETAASDRVLIDQLKWAAGKRRPRDYGDRQTVEHTGTVGHLHLDALRSLRNARNDNALRDTDDVTPKLPATSQQDSDSDATPIETTGIYPGWGDPKALPSSEGPGRGV